MEWRTEPIRVILEGQDILCGLLDQVPGTAALESRCLMKLEGPEQQCGVEEAVVEL